MKRNMKRFAEGETVEDLRDDTSQSTGIDDSVRARAMKFLQTGKKDEESKPVARKTTSIAKKETAKTETKDTSDQNERRSKQAGYEKEPKNFRVPDKEKGLESVHPEDYIPGAGILKGLARGAGRLVEKQAAKEVEKRIVDRTEKAAIKESKDSARRSAEGYSPEEAVRKLDEPARKLRTESSGAMKGTFKPSEIREGFKSGGTARTSSSKRGDGIATKGFTRGKYC